MTNLNENVQTLYFFVFLIIVVSLWKNLPQWRTPRQTEEGIFHRLLAKLCRSLVFGAAWWYEFVGGFACYVSSYPTKLFWPRWPRFSGRVENGVSYLVEFLLLKPLAWPIAGNYLRNKWQLEIDEENRKYREGKRL